MNTVSSHYIINLPNLSSTGIDEAGTTLIKEQLNPLVSVLRTCTNQNLSEHLLISKIKSNVTSSYPERCCEKQRKKEHKCKSLCIILSPPVFKNQIHDPFLLLGTTMFKPVLFSLVGFTVILKKYIVSRT